ncbi:MAG: hypothetical protein K2I91_06585, partial [Muribaculaceae bacterium]|nr:hypothetical protein [Muribaculaceae bacterium]
GNVLSFTTSSRPAKVTTSGATDVTAKTATINGAVTDAGVPAYTERGFCYSNRNTVPDISDSKTVVAGNGTGDFSLQLTSLDYPSTYYARAYVIQGGGVIYGNVVSFRTEKRAPSVRTSAVTDVTTTTATFNGIVTDLGMPRITRRGFCYSTVSTNPTINDDHWDDYSVNTSAYYRKMSRLTKGATYSVRAYAYQEGEYYYGDTVSFSTIAEPEVVTGNPENLTKEEGFLTVSWSVTLHGTVLSEGSTPYSERGFVYDTTSYATPNGSNSVVVAGHGTGSFSATVTGLQDFKYYYIRAYVKVGNKYYYGDAKRLSTFRL